MALAASMALVSCDKSENDVVPTDTQLKRVTIKLPNLTSPSSIGSRAVGDAMENNSQVALSNFKVFFLDADGNEVTIPEYPAGTAQKLIFPPMIKTVGRQLLQMVETLPTTSCPIQQSRSL